VFIGQFGATGVSAFMPAKYRGICTMIGKLVNAPRAQTGGVRPAIFVTRVSAVVFGFALVLAYSGSARTQPFEPGMAVASCAARLPSDPVVGIKDIRDPLNTGGVLGQEWNYTPLNPAISSAPEIATWAYNDLGPVFGLAIGAQGTGGSPEIFATTTVIYDTGGGYSGDAPVFTPPNGYHAVWRLQSNGLLSGGTFELFYQFPNDPALSSLGQVAYNPSPLQPVVYVSNFDDGMITAIQDTTGTGLGNAIDTYDHGINRDSITLTSAFATVSSFPKEPDTPSTNKTPIYRRVWAVQVNPVDNRLYYGVVDEIGNYGAQNRTQRLPLQYGPTSSNLLAVWSVALDPINGNFILGSTRRELEFISARYLLGDDTPIDAEISDIAFSDDGNKMIIAERGGAHGARVFHVNRATTSSPWNGPTGTVPAATSQAAAIAGLGYGTSPQHQLIGGAVGGNSAGGVDFTYGYNIALNGIDTAQPEARVLSTGNVLYELPPAQSNNWVYGIQSTEFNNVLAPAPFDSSKHYFVDLNGDITGTVDKTEIGDVEAYRTYTGGGATIKICKVAGEGVDISTEFDFGVGWDGASQANVSIPAGPAPGGYCKVAATNVPTDREIAVGEIQKPGYQVTQIDVAGAGIVDEISVPNRFVKFSTVGEGVTEVTFTNKNTRGYLEICKAGHVDGEFTFTVDDVDGTVGSYTVPSGTCTPAIAVMAGEVTITETPTQGVIMGSCSTLVPDSSYQLSCEDWTSVVKIDPGDISTQTIAFIENKWEGRDNGGAGNDDGGLSPARRRSDAGKTNGTYALANYQRINGVIGDRPAATIVACAPHASPTAELTTCTATVDGLADGSAPTGMVEFVSGDKTIAILPLKTDGTATLALPANSTEHHGEVFAAYGGNGTFAGSASHAVGYSSESGDNGLLWSQSARGGVIGATSRIAVPNAESVAAPAKIYNPGEPAPTDNEAERLNKSVFIRLFGNDVEF